MKAAISNRIYLKVTREYRELLEAELTYKIPSYKPTDPPFIIKNIARIRDDLVSIPSGRTDLIPEGYEIVDKRVTNPANFPEFRFELRESQALVHDAFDDSGIINAWVSWGKTFTGLAIAAKLGQKTLVVVHTVALRKQWEREVEKVFGIKPGVIGSGEFNIDAPIVVANVQSLYKNIRAVQKEFGTLILDEMHHVSAPTFSRIIDTSHARYKVGLTGTLERKDQKHVVFKDYFGEKLYQPPKENYMVPKVHIVRTNIRFQDGHTPWAIKVNNLTNTESYIHLVSVLAATYAAKGHKVLVVSDRVHFLHNCADLVGENAVAITGRIATLAERENLMKTIGEGSKEIIFGTQAIFSEGISINELSCLILATPLNNIPLLTQLIGRVIRKQENKPTPIVVDIHLVGKTVTSQASNRMGHYMKEGYQILEVQA